MPKPRNIVNTKMETTRITRTVKRGLVTKKKNRLKKLDLESSQQTISHVEKAEEVDEETRRREREDDRRRWLQQQRIKYPVAPDGYIPNSIVRRNLQPYVPRPPEKLPEEKTKLTFLERRLSRFDRMNSFEMLDASEFRLIDNASRTSSASLNAVDRDRPSSKKKLRSDVINDVVTQIRETSPQLTSFLELEDIAEVEPRLEASASTLTPEGVTRERERDEGKRGRRGEMEEEQKRGEVKGDQDAEELKGSGRAPPHTHISTLHDHTSPSSFTSVAKQPRIHRDLDHVSTTINQNKHFMNQENEDNGSSDLKQRRDDEGLDSDAAGVRDGDNDVNALSAAAHAKEDVDDDGEGDITGRGGDDIGDLESYPSFNWKIPTIVEPEDDGNETAEEEHPIKGEEEGREGEDGREGGGEGGGEVIGGEGELANEQATEHYGNSGVNDVIGERLDGAPHGGDKEKRSSEEVDNDRRSHGASGQMEEEGQGFDSKEKEEEEEERVKVLHFSLPIVRQLEEEDSVANDTKKGTEKERVYDPERDLLLNPMTKVEPEVDEVESDGRRRVDGKEAIGGEWGDGETVSPSYSALRPPRLHDDELDLTSFDSSMAATNASLPTFVESPNGDKDDGRRHFPKSRSTRNANDFSMEGYNEGEEKKGQQDEEEAEEREEEEERFWSSCSNGRLNRRHSREMMDEGSNPSPPLGWHLSWYERHHQGDLPHSTTHRRDATATEAETVAGFLPQLLLSSTKDEQKKRRHHGCEYSILVQRRMHEHISVTRYLRTKKLAEVLCDLRRPINANIIKFQYAV